MVTVARTMKDSEKAEIVTQLNELRLVLQRQVEQGGPAEEYRNRVYAAAAPLYATIAETCALGFEVWAEKHNGRVLKIGAVGSLEGTRFPYVRWPHLPISGNDSCELVAIVNFTLDMQL
jgi:hypothetical protein